MMALCGDYDLIKMITSLYEIQNSYGRKVGKYINRSTRM